MKVLLMGGTGFVGSYIIDELINNEIVPRLLIRKGSEYKLLQAEQCELVFGDISHDSAIRDAMQDCDAIIYNIGIIREFPEKGITFQCLHYIGVKKCVEIAKELNINRFILMSANGVYNNRTEYQKSKLLAEEYLKSADLDYTIFHPSLIFGDPRGNNRPEFCTQLKKDMLSLPFPAPIFYTGLNPLKAGNYALSPIHAKDVATIFVKSIQEEKTVKKTFSLGGETYYWRDIISIISKAYEKNKWTIPVPVFAIKGIAKLFERFSWFPITNDQLTMLIEGNVCQSKNIYRMFDITPIPFNFETLDYLRS